MRRILRSDRAGFSPWLVAVVILVVIIAVVALLFLAPMLSPKPMRLYATATLADGRTVTIADSSAGPLGSIVTYNGQTVTAFHFYTTFKGTSSSGYTQYTITSGNTVGTFRMMQSYTRCQQITLSAQMTRSPPSPFSMGTTYNLGDLATTGSGSPSSVLDVASSSIVSWSTMCAGVAAYTLIYSISLSSQAVGTGSLPTATWSGSVSVNIAVATGSMTLTGTNTFTTSS